MPCTNVWHTVAICVISRCTSHNNDDREIIINKGWDVKHANDNCFHISMPFKKQRVARREEMMGTTVHIVEVEWPSG